MCLRKKKPQSRNGYVTICILKVGRAGAGEVPGWLSSDFGSGCDLLVREFELRIGLSALSTDPLFPLLSLSFPRPCLCLLTLKKYTF